VGGRRWWIVTPPSVRNKQAFANLQPNSDALSRVKRRVGWQISYTIKYIYFPAFQTHRFFAFARNVRMLTITKEHTNMITKVNKLLEHLTKKINVRHAIDRY